MSLAHHKTAFI